MRQRAISALIFVIAMIGGVFGGPVPFYVLFLAITIGALWELMGMLMGPDANLLFFRKITGTLLGCLPFLVYGSTVFELGFDPLLLSVTLLLPAVFLAFIAELFLQSDRPFTLLGHYTLGVLYVGLPFALLISIAFWHGNYAPMRVFGLLLLIWANDTFAYLTGYFMGKTPFFPRISPKKTWEGAIGGILFTCGGAFLLAQYFPEFSLQEWVALAFCVAVFGTLGDLVESMLKRSVQVKDSGAILPGHGGFLDRFDSFIFVLPFVWLALMILQD